MPEAQCMASRIGIASWLSLQLNVFLSNAKKNDRNDRSQTVMGSTQDTNQLV